jgi:RTX calcium-binding nonapeptide repeat (4 copies)
MVLGSTSSSGAETITNSGTLQILSASGADGSATLQIAGNLTINNTGGTIQLDGGEASIIQSSGDAASLTLNGGTIEGSGDFGNDDADLTLTIDTGTTVDANNGNVLSLATDGTTILNHGLLECQSSIIYIYSPLTSDGTILANAGIVAFNDGATSTGMIDIGNGGQIDIHETLTGSVTFTGSSGKLALYGTFTGNVIGARAGDTIDFGSQLFAAGDQSVWQQNGATGTLMIEDSNGTVLQTMTLTGQYASADFGLPSGDFPGSPDPHTQIMLVAAPVTVQTSSGVDLRWATLYDELANSTIATGATATQYTAVDGGNFNGHTASLKFVVSGTGFTYSGTGAAAQVAGGTITQIQVEDLSSNVLATFAGLSISGAPFQSAINSYIAGGASPDASALNTIFLSLIYNTTGGAGADKLQGGNAANVFDASTGNDTLAGGTGSNSADYSGLSGSGLTAIIQGGGGTVNKGDANGTDTLTGVTEIVDTAGRGSGDHFYVDAGETVTGNSANFDYLIELTAGVTLSYGTNFTGIAEFVSNTGTNVVDFTNDASFAYLYGSTNSDTLSLGSGGGYLFGEGGANTLYGGQNATNLFVGGSGGTDTMNGGTGTASNFYYVDGNDTINGAGAFNTAIELVASVTAQIGSAQYQEVQELVTDGGTNTITVAGGDSDFTYLYGGAGTDTLTTGSGGGYLFGEGGSNTLNGGGGLNVFVADGASGADTMNGGTGSNIYFIDSHSIVNGAGTFNTVVELQQSATLTLGSNLFSVEQIIFNGGTNSADFRVAAQSVYLYGGSGNDTLLGGGANDFLFGGLGSNTFQFAAGWGQDTIEDWTAGTGNILDLTLLSGQGVHTVSDLTQTISGGMDVITSVHTGTNSITLLGVGTALTAGSFHFA